MKCHKSGAVGAINQQGVEEEVALKYINFATLASAAPGPRSMARSKEILVRIGTPAPFHLHTTSQHQPANLNLNMLEPNMSHNIFEYTKVYL